MGIATHGPYNAGNISRSNAAGLKLSDNTSSRPLLNSTNIDPDRNLLNDLTVTSAYATRTLYLSCELIPYPTQFSVLHLTWRSIFIKLSGTNELLKLQSINHYPFHA